MWTAESPGGIHLDYQQMHGGLPVFGAGAKLHFDPVGALLLADIDIRTDIPPDEPLRIPVIGADKAEDIAVSHLGGREVLRGEPTKELGILPLSVGRYGLAWRVLCPAYEPAGDWLFQIDAATGNVISRENVLVELYRARVFSPTPLSPQEISGFMTWLWLETATMP